MTILNSRERKALQAMDACTYQYELKEQMGAEVGRRTLKGLLDRGFAVMGPSPRQPGQMGYAITDEGRKALNQSYRTL